MDSKPPLLSMRGITRNFPGVRALHNASLRLYAGEIHTVMGQNGAGKSTLIKVLTGVHPAHEGEIYLNGERIQPNSPLEAQALGIATVYQEVNLCPNLSVAENIFIGRFPKRHQAIDWKKLQRDAQTALARLNLHIDVTRPLDDFPVAIQQMVAIARVVSIDASVLILDEPTSSLDESEVEQLFTIMRMLKESGVAILFVTHFLDQVYAVSDRITVMRNGECEGEYLPHELDRMQLISKMIGRPYVPTSEACPSAEAQAAQESVPMMSVSGLGRRGTMRPLDLEMRRGEVLGLGGLLGSGRTETARMLFGADKADSGDIQLASSASDGTNGSAVKKHRPFSSPGEAIAQGLGYCPEDRKTEGIVADLSVRENIILALQARRGWLRGIPLKKQRAIADQYIEMLGIRTPNADKPIGQLSGGNQQKAMLARWLATDPRMLILDEPTRGIDVAAKQEIMDQVLALCRKGLSILFISSDLDETVRVSHRVAVLRDRNKVGELSGKEVEEHAIMRVIAGSDV